MKRLAWAVAASLFLLVALSLLTAQSASAHTPVNACTHSSKYVASLGTWKYQSSFSRVNSKDPSVRDHIHVQYFDYLPSQNALGLKDHSDNVLCGQFFVKDGKRLWFWGSPSTH